LLNSKRKSEDKNEIEDEKLNKKPKIDIEKPINSSESSTIEMESKPINQKQPTFDPTLLEKDPDCFECKQVYRDPKRKDLIMYLHALSYRVSVLFYLIQHLNPNI
jgi:hypothetical protein